MSLQTHHMQATAKQKRPRGRPTVYTPAIADEIIERVADGESLSSICRDEHMPSRPIVCLWATGGGEVGKLAERGDKTAAAFVDRYARARLLGLDRMAEEVIEISDAPILFEGVPDNALVQQARLRSDNRKWMLSKMLPKQFGDKVTAEITGDPDAPLITKIILEGVAAKRLDPPTIDADDGFVDGSEPSSKDKP